MPFNKELQLCETLMHSEAKFFSLRKQKKI